MRLSIFILLMAFLITACSQEPLQDNVTKQDINKITVTSGLNVVHHSYDNMDRGHHEYDGVDIVIDLNYYKTYIAQRGDVVYYKNPKLENSNVNLSGNEISRIVALPGETIRIDKGQIYIDGRRLDTFYGQAHRFGMNIQELQKASSQKDITDNIRENFKENIKFIQESAETNKQDFKVPDGQYYIIGDDWFRSADSRHFGSITKDSILGKVNGELNKE